MCVSLKIHGLRLKFFRHSQLVSGEFAIFSVSAKASLPISLSPPFDLSLTHLPINSELHASNHQTDPSDDCLKA